MMEGGGGGAKIQERDLGLQEGWIIGGLAEVRESNNRWLEVC